MSGTTAGQLRLRAPDGAEIPLLFVEDGARLYVLPSERGARWAVEALRVGWCEVQLRDEGWTRCAATPVDDPHENERWRARFRATYGSDVWARHFERSGRVIELDPQAPASPRSAADRVRGEFDAAAASYADRVAQRSVERYLKETTLERLRELFQGRDPLLEIGPGPGLETVPLLEAGHRVVAVDTSPGMLSVLTDRARAARVEPGLTTRRGALGELGTVLADLEAGTFAGAFSTFGAFNLEPNVGALGRDLGRLVRPGGRLAFTSLNRPGVAPFLWEAIAGHPRVAFGRLRTAWERLGESYPLDAFPRRPSEWDALLTPAFHRRSTMPVSVLAPPFEPSIRWPRPGPRGRRYLRGVDRRLSRRSRLSEVAEWAFLVYERSGPSGRGEAGRSESGV